MRRIIQRYILREITQTWVVVTVVLLLILLVARFARYIGKAAAGELPPDAVFQLIALTAVQYFTILVPVALFLAIILALGRLNADNETAAMEACGVGLRDYIRPVALLALPVALLMAWLAFDLSPRAARYATEVEAEAEQSATFSMIEAGRFRSFDGGRGVFYAREVSGDELRGVFVRARGQAEDDTTEVVITAERAQLVREASGARMLMLHDGYRYHGKPGEAAYQEIRFERHGMRYQPPPVQPSHRRHTRPTSELWASQWVQDKAELHWRLAMPVSVLLLAMLAIPLARAAPRQGRSWGLLLGILVYLVYSNLLGVGQAWIERERMPLELGLWWVHALLGGVIILALAWHYGFGWVLGYARRPRSPA